MTHLLELKVNIIHCALIPYGRAARLILMEVMIMSILSFCDNKYSLYLNRIGAKDMSIVHVR